MTAYVGQTRSRSLVRELSRRGIGECVVTGEMDPRRGPFFHDCGAYRDHQARRPFNYARWQRDMRRIRYRGLIPSFVLAPDLIFGGNASIDYSATFRGEIDAPAYLAVQNGMEVQRVRDAVLRDRYSGLFVGGDDVFKLETTPAWVALARDLGILIHVGRVGTPAKVAWARSVGVDSIDSSFPLFHSDHLAAFVEALAGA